MSLFACAGAPTDSLARPQIQPQSQNHHKKRQLMLVQPLSISSTFTDRSHRVSHHGLLAVTRKKPSDKLWTQARSEFVCSGEFIASPWPILGGGRHVR